MFGVSFHAGRLLGFFLTLLERALCTEIVRKSRWNKILCMMEVNLRNIQV